MKEREQYEDTGIDGRQIQSIYDRDKVEGRGMDSSGA